MKPRIIVSVLDSLSGPTDVALTRALSLAHQYDSELHAVHLDVPDRVGRRDGEAINAGLVERIRRIAERSAVAGVTVVPAMLSGSPVRAIADYTDQRLSAVDWKNIKLISSVEDSLGGPISDGEHFGRKYGWFGGA